MTSWIFWLACAGSGGGELPVHGAWARATPPGAENGAVFLTVENPGTRARAVVEARSPAARRVELHTHVTVDGTMQMRRVERFEVPAGGAAVLAPGGDHVMLLGLTGELSAGSELPLTLVLDDGTAQVVTVPVRDTPPGG